MTTLRVFNCMQAHSKKASLVTVFAKLIHTCGGQAARGQRCLEPTNMLMHATQTVQLDGESQGQQGHLCCVVVGKSSACEQF